MAPDTDTETGIRFWGKENIRMKGKGRHFFRKIEPVTSIFVNHEGYESTFTLSM